MKPVEFFARVGSVAGLEPAAREVSGRIVQRMIGFWVMWHLSGGFDGLMATGWLSRTAIYRSRGEFQRIMHVEVENFWPEAAAFMASERERMAP